MNKLCRQSILLSYATWRRHWRLLGRKWY